MYILGISCFDHDSAAALIRDGQVVAAAMEERFSRIRHDSGWPTRAVNFCLRRAGIAPSELDYVVFYEKPLVKFERVLMSAIDQFPRSGDKWREAMFGWLPEKLWIKSHIQSRLKVDISRILFCDHHMSHAASAFFCSPYDKAALLTVDGVGEWTTTTMGRATADWTGSGRNAIELFSEQNYPNSLGLMYAAFTTFLGFNGSAGGNEVMAMAPYGTPKYTDKIYKLISLNNDGSFSLDLNYFAFHYSSTQTFSQRFVELFGEPRSTGADFFTLRTNPERSAERAAIERNQYYADIAASIQAVTGDAPLRTARTLYRQTGLKALCFAGGVALNAAANLRLLRETPFEEVYIQPAAGDDGGALGAALWAYHIVLGKQRAQTMDHAYWGESYSDDTIRSFLEGKGIRYESFADDTQLLDRAVDALSQGKILGWFQGPFEWGPRALGNRSILADPRQLRMKQAVNARIRAREVFHPLSPVILAERAAEFIDVPNVEKAYPARFRLMASPVRDSKRSLIPAAVHEGGSARPQTIDRVTNPRLYELIRRFGEATAVPVLLNSSFSLGDEPIVNSPADAWNTFTGSGLDLLAIGSYLVSRS